MASVTTLSISSGELVLTLPRMTQCFSNVSRPKTISAMSTLSCARLFSVMAPKCGLSLNVMWAWSMSRWRVLTGISQGSQTTKLP